MGAALGLTPTELNLEGGLKRGKLADGQDLDVAARPAMGGALYTIAAAPSGPDEVTSLQLQLGRLLAVWGASMVVGILLITQSRKAEAAQRTSSIPNTGSAWRLRRRVAASGNGIWKPTRCTCPTSPARSSAGAAAASSLAMK